jgi:hypothetical protein
MRKLPVLLLMFLPSLSAFAQGGLLTTGQKYVKAFVEDGGGWVQVKIFPGKPTDGTLNFPRMSFVSFNVNGKVFTNNHVGLSSPLPPNTFILTDGTISSIPGIIPNTDTIRCVWLNKDSIDLIQEVYPVLFERSEQIVFRWKAINKSSHTAIIAVQYLNDVQVGDSLGFNDASKMLTTYGYRPNWDLFSASIEKDVPWFYASFQFPLPNNPTFNPGVTGIGYTDNIFANLGLTKPSQQTIGDWKDLIKVRWGPPSPLSNGLYNDGATLLEFWEVEVNSSNEVLIGSTSYGTGEFEICKGQLFGMVFYPHRINWNPPNLNPNPFRLDFFAFNPQSTTEAPQTTLTLTVGNNLTIIGPSPIINNGKSQTQPVSNNGVIAPLGVSHASWTVLASNETQCKREIISSLKFTALSPGLGYPIFVDEIEYSDTCDHPIIIECTNLSAIEPNIVDEASFKLLGNPASDKATIQLTLEKSQDVTLRIIDALGREVRRVDVKGLPQGENLIPLQTSDLASGTYYVLLEFGNRQLTRSLKVIR